MYRNSTCRIVSTAFHQLVLGLLLATAADAQRDREQSRERDDRSEHEDYDDGPRRHAVECRLAAKVMETGHPHSRQRWARNKIMSCNAEAPRALIAQLRRASGTRDTTELRALITGAEYVRDTGYFNAALDLAANPSATAEARAVGFLVTAIELTDRMSFSLAKVLLLTDRWPCDPEVYDHSLRTGAGTALPADAIAHLRTAVATALSNPATPMVIANAARCAKIVTDR